MEMTVLAAQLPVPLVEKLDEISEHLGQPRDWVVAHALADWFNREEERRLRTLRRLPNVDALVIVEQDRIIAWADSL
ncbi:MULTISPECIES: CopG family transcriptional regulator [unclassified Sinorhizobium]|uniref:CopG family transcriptional regulator n=1 Tax=unclassified Sinorhizobium TaxID=2613772 RepID=UPI003525C959